MIEHLATRIDGGCSLEAVTLAQDRVDDVYLDGAGSLRDSRSFPVTPDRRTSDAPRPTAWSSPSVTNSADLPRSRSRRIQAAVPVPPAASPATASQRDSRAVHAENATVILNSLPAKPGTRKPANPSASEQSSIPTYLRTMRRLEQTPGQNRIAGRSIHRLGAGGRRIVRLSQFGDC